MLSDEGAKKIREYRDRGYPIDPIGWPSDAEIGMDQALLALLADREWRIEKRKRDKEAVIAKIILWKGEAHEDAERLLKRNPSLLGDDGSDSSYYLGVLEGRKQMAKQIAVLIRNPQGS